MSRILYLVPNAVPGGAERATMLMLAAHKRQRYDPEVLFFSDGMLVDAARQLGLETHVLTRPMHLRHPLSVRAAVAECVARVRQRGYALIHSCMSYAHLVGGVASAVAGVPGVLYQHGPVGSWMDGAATLVGCDHILTNSQFSADQQRARSWRTRPITVVPYGIDLHLTSEERAVYRRDVNAEHHLAPGMFVVGMLARFDPWKGIDVALRAMAPLLRDRPNIRFIIVGGQYRHFHPEYGAYLRSIVASERIADQVIFAGFRADVRRYYARLDALLHCSLQPEPFGLTIVEAMAAGVPVVAAGGGGPADIIDPDVDGVMHAGGDVESLRAAIRRVLDDAPLREALITAGLHKVEVRYRPASMGAAIEAVYDRLLNRPS